MASIIRHDSHWKNFSRPPAMLLYHAEPGWEFREVAYADGGSWDHVTTTLHVASHLDPIRQRIGPSRAPFLWVAPSAAVSAPGDHLSGAWEGAGRAQHVLISPRLVAAVAGRDVDPAQITRRRFARTRAPDAQDLIVQHLLASLAAEIRSHNPAGPAFLQTVVTALIQHALAPTVAGTQRVARGGLSPAQLRRVLDTIDAKLAGRPSLVDLATALNVSTRYFCRAFRASTGCSPHQFILRRRVEQARAMIERGDMALSEIAIAAGFVDHSQMTTTFRKVLSATPSHFRRRKSD